MRVDLVILLWCGCACAISRQGTQPLQGLLSPQAGPLIWGPSVGLRLRGAGSSRPQKVDAERPSIASLDREAASRWREKKDFVLSWEDSPRLSDRAIGIREYVRRARKGRRSKGTGGLLKASWSDFRVTEVCERTRRPLQLTHARDPGPRPLGANFLSLSMAKIGFDTISAVGRICSWLGVPRDRVTFAGIKDKSAVTCQQLTIDARGRSLDVDKLRNISRWIPRILGESLASRAALYQQHSVSGSPSRATRFMRSIFHMPVNFSPAAKS